MSMTDTPAQQSLSKATLSFFPTLAVQLVIGIMVTIGLLHLGFWKTAVLEICKLAIVTPQAFQLRRAAVEQDIAVSAAPLLTKAAVGLLAISAFADAILISYDIQRGIGH
jgi:uncharacterized membrane protein